jgi:hypothetical protein
MWKRAAAFVFTVAALSLPVGILVVRRLPFRTTRPVLAVLFTWMGASFLLFSALLATDLARLLFSGFRWIASTVGSPAELPSDPARRVFVARTLAGGAAFLATGAAASGVHAATGEPRILDVPVRLERLPPALSGFTIAQISDLHVGATIRGKHVQRVVELTNALRADAVVITGDLVDGSVAELRGATEHLARLHAKHGVWFVNLAPIGDPAESRSHLLNVNATVIEERQETVAGQPANRIDYTISNDDVLYRSALEVTAIGDTGYSFNLWALPESFDTLSGGLKTVLSSFRVDGTR